MLVGYMRVSKADGSQSLDLQRDALAKEGVEPHATYEDMASGKRDDRPGLEACVKALRSGDVLVVWKLDRLGRSLRHSVETVDNLNERGIESHKLDTFFGDDEETPDPSEAAAEEPESESETPEEPAAGGE